MRYPGGRKTNKMSLTLTHCETTVAGSISARNCDRIVIGETLLIDGRQPPPNYRASWYHQTVVSRIDAHCGRGKADSGKSCFIGMVKSILVENKCPTIASWTFALLRPAKHVSVAKTSSHLPASSSSGTCGQVRLQAPAQRGWENDHEFLSCMQLVVVFQYETGPCWCSSTVPGWHMMCQITAGPQKITSKEQSRHCVGCVGSTAAAAETDARSLEHI